MISNNPDYKYEFFDDTNMRDFIDQNFDKETLECFDSLNVGAAKADLWRYLILFKRGGVYLDMDSEIYGKLDDFIKSDDQSIVSREGHYGKFVQWCLMFSPNHPILEICIRKCLENIRDKKIINIIDLTGPTVFSDSINEYCKNLNIDIWTTNDLKLNKMITDNNLNLRVYSKDYEGLCNFKGNFYPYLESYNLYNSKPSHWTQEKKIFN
jgi:mannosyltransferase OCH1-like enzyme